MKYELTASTGDPEKASRFYRKIFGRAEGASAIQSERRSSGTIEMAGVLEKDAWLHIMILFGFNVFI